MDIERFWLKVDKTGECWVWTAAKTEGYGTFQGKLAHRISYELQRGPIPGNLQLDHLCRNRACVNPDHLEAVTRKENILRGQGWGAINARKTHCKHGHEYNQYNTYIMPSGGRDCRVCQRERYYRKRDAK